MRAFFLPIALLALAGITADMQTPDIRVITGATLINPTPAAPVSNAVIVITGSRITQVGTAASVKPPAGAQVIDAAGKFVIPGLADMHNHLEDGGINQRQKGDRQEERAHWRGF